MNADRHFKVVSVSALCMAHYLADSARLGWALRRAVEHHYDGTVAFLASGSLAHRFAQNGLRWAEFCGMLPEYAAKGHGEGFMHDTAMLLGALGWSGYDGAAEIVTPYFGASGTGEVNAVFPVRPNDGAAVPGPVASRAEGYLEAHRAAARL